MLCPRCGGRGMEMEIDVVRPCGECDGVGHIHCCEGDCSQPEPIVLVKPAAKQFLEANYPREK